MSSFFGEYWALPGMGFDISLQCFVALPAIDRWSYRLVVSLRAEVARQIYAA